MRYLYLAGFVACVPVANWLIHNIGTRCIPDGPCLIPVGFGLDSPSGVLVIGLALVLRDLVHETLGAKWALAAIMVGGLISGFIAPLALAVASIVAFTLSELADMAVYSPLRKRKLWLAVVLSGLAGSVVDSGLFLYLAFGSFDHIAGNVVGKMWFSLAAIPVILMMRKSK